MSGVLMGCRRLAGRVREGRTLNNMALKKDCCEWPNGCDPVGVGILFLGGIPGVSPKGVDSFAPAHVALRAISLRSLVSPEPSQAPVVNPRLLEL